MTSDHHFREWTHFGGLLCESSKGQEEEHIALRSVERMIYGHYHRGMVEPPPTTRDSICVCAKWHGWKPITLAEAIRQMDAAEA